jgi:hypothetical protein
MLLKEAKMLTEKNFDTGSVTIHYVEGPPRNHHKKNNRRN